MKFFKIVVYGILCFAVLYFAVFLYFNHVCMFSQNLAFKEYNDAIAKFYCTYNRMPTNLREMVKAEILPEKGKIYYCCLLHNSIIRRKILYSDCEYDLEFKTNEVIVMLPSEPLENELYKHLKKRNKIRIEQYVMEAYKRRVMRTNSYFISVISNANESTYIDKYK